ncbi:MAG: hypothetical protein PHW74_01900 [Desulfobacca sp.]|nr:hypothetical protein [Desulfobacca sp.]
MKKIVYLLSVSLISFSLATEVLAQREIAPPAASPLADNSTLTVPPPVVEPPPPVAPPSVQGKLQPQVNQVTPPKSPAVRIKQGQAKKPQSVKAPKVKKVNRAHKAKAKTGTAKQNLKIARGDQQPSKIKNTSPKQLRQTATIRRR